MIKSYSDWMVRGFGAVLSIANILGFISALASIWSGEADYITLIVAIIVTITLPMVMNLTTYQANDDEIIVRIANFAYAVCLSLLFCSTYVIVSSVVIDNPRYFFYFLYLSSPHFSDFIPIASPTLMFLLAYGLMNFYSRKMGGIARTLISIPILLVFGFVTIRYVTFNGIRPLIESANEQKMIGLVALCYVMILTAILIFSGLKSIIDAASSTNPKGARTKNSEEAEKEPGSPIIQSGAAGNMKKMEVLVPMNRPHHRSNDPVMVQRKTIMVPDE